MAENPVVTLARLLGGVVLMQGRLGHQVLGQMLVAGSNEVAIAGASLVIAASARQRSAVKQIALRVAAPALAVRGLLRKEEQRVERKAAIVAERERRLESRASELARGEAALATRRTAVEAELDARRTAVEAARAADMTALEGRRSDLEAELERLSKRLRSTETARKVSSRRKTARRGTKRRRK